MWASGAGGIMRAGLWFGYCSAIHCSAPHTRHSPYSSQSRRRITYRRWRDAWVLSTDDPLPLPDHFGGRVTRLSLASIAGAATSITCQASRRHPHIGDLFRLDAAYPCESKMDLLARTNHSPSCKNHCTAYTICVVEFRYDHEPARGRG